jgi:hypothetical protein
MFTKLKLVLLLFSFSALLPANAQFTMDGGEVDLGIRLGGIFPNTDKFKHPEEKYHAIIPALGFTFETGLGNAGFSAGGEFNYVKYINQDDDGYMTVLTGMIFAKYYPAYLTFGNVAPYVRADLIPIGIAKVRSPEIIDTEVAWINGIYLAASYQLNESFAAFAEVGTGYTVVNGGINWRLH